MIGDQNQRIPWAPNGVVLDGEIGKGIRVAVTGASHWHLPRYAAHLREAAATVVAVADRDQSVAERWAAQLGAAAARNTDDIMRHRPDVVLALGRPCDMAAQAVELLDAGVPLLAEKPLGISPEEVAHVAQTAARRGAWVAVALVRRYDPIWWVLDRLAEEDVLGRVAHAHMRIVNGPPQRYVAWGSDWMLDRSLAGGGALLNLGIHGMDFIRHLADEPLTVVGAAVGAAEDRGRNPALGLDTKGSGGIEDYAVVTLRSASGVLASVEAGYTYPDAAAGMTRAGDSETRIGASGAYLTERDGALRAITERGESPHGGPDRCAGDRYRDWLFDSLARLRRGAAPVADVRDCLEAVSLVFDAYRCAGVTRVGGDAAG